MKVAQWIVNALKGEGVKYIFGIPGMGIMDIIGAVQASSDLKFILTRHEQGAAFMADGYARASRGLGVCIGFNGPGVTNMVTGVASAYKCSSPVLVITGRPVRDQLEKDYFTKIDEVSLFRPITRFSHAITNLEDVEEVMHKAFRMALCGRRGPVYVSIPMDVQREEISWEEMGPGSYRPVTAPVLIHSVETVVELLKAAKRPLILAGNELLWEETTEKLIKLAEYLRIPVVTTRDHQDAFPSTHPLGLGPLGVPGPKMAQDAVREADLILAMGVKFDSWTTRLGYQVISKGTKIVQVHPDPEVLGATYPLAVGLASPVTPFLGSLMVALGTAPWKIDYGWDVERRKREGLQEALRQAEAEAVPINIDYLARMVRKALREDAIIVTDSGDHKGSILAQFDTFLPGTHFSSWDYGAVGASIPIALGVKLARPDKQVVAFCGDGGMMMSLPELETAVRENINVAVVVANNYSLMALRVTNPDFGRVMELFGGVGFRVTDPKELEDVLSAAFNAGRPSIVDVAVETRPA